MSVFLRSFTIYAPSMHIPYVGSIRSNILWVQHKIPYVSLLINSTLHLAQSRRVRSLTFTELSEEWCVYNILFCPYESLFHSSMSTGFLLHVSCFD